MEIEDFNAMSASEAATAVRPCVDIDSWVDAVVGGRPYADLDALLATADRQASGWTGTEVEAALADHPRIGERPTGSGASAAMSAREQAGVDPTDADAATAPGRRQPSLRGEVRADLPGARRGPLAPRRCSTSWSSD